MGLSNVYKMKQAYEDHQWTMWVDSLKGAVQITVEFSMLLHCICDRSTFQEGNSIGAQCVAELHNNLL